ncbi:hypothetical protein [Amycolatopsis taiwanensis]|uniref:hypothetical protein n=1 Tax=Amycolatopsis taiwanensis TaxID=342230 RepID=UPI0004AED8AB|nr:hypothetical protein [Amycolatopsis taiwanensis]
MVTACVFADDLLDGESILMPLNASPVVQVLPAGRHAEADVVVVVAAAVTGTLLESLEEMSARAENPRQRMMLVSGPLRGPQLARAVGCGVVSILPRAGITPRVVLRAVIASGTGGAVVPEAVTRWLLDEARTFQQTILAGQGPHHRRPDRPGGGRAPAARRGPRHRFRGRRTELLGAHDQEDHPEPDRTVRTVDAGLEVVGVHTPEFEHDPGNVADQAAKLGVHYPVAIDDDYRTWSAYGNHYWPAAYLVDATGQVRSASFGEGGYTGFEQQIRAALTDSGARSLPPATDVPDTTPGASLTPEIYLGAEHTPLATSGARVAVGQTRAYTFPAGLDPDTFALDGTWTSDNEYLTAGPDARLRLDFHASSVHLVLGGTGTVTVDGTRTITVTGPPTPYTLLDGHSGHGRLTISATPGVQAYDFTFG